MYLYLALANLFWAGNYVFGEMVTREISPISLTFFRWAFAFLPLLGIAWLIERPNWREALREWPLHLLQSLLGLTGYTLLLYAALGLTGAVNAAVISAINPATIALGAAIFLHERLNRVQVLGLVVAFVGVTVVLTGGDVGQLVEQGFGVGDLLVIGSVLAWTVYSLDLPPPRDAADHRHRRAGRVRRRHDAAAHRGHRRLPAGLRGRRARARLHRGLPVDGRLRALEHRRLEGRSRARRHLPQPAARVHGDHRARVRRHPRAAGRRSAERS